MKNILIILCCAMLSACVTSASKPNIDDVKNIDKVGIISLVGDEFSLDYVGATVFNNQVNFVVISDLNADSKILINIESALKQRTSIESVRVPYDRQSLMKVHCGAETLERSEYLKCAPDLKNIMPDLSKLAQINNTRYMIIATRGGYVGYANAAHEGFGIIDFKDQEYGAFIFINFSLIDTKEEKIISRRMSIGQIKSPPIPFHHLGAEYSSAELDAFRPIFTKHLEDWTPSSVAYLFGLPLKAPD